MLDLQRLIDAAAYADCISSAEQTYSLRLRITGVEVGCGAGKVESYRVVGYRSIEQAPVNPLITTLNDMAREVVCGRN